MEQYLYDEVMEAIESFNNMGASIRKKLVERFNLDPYKVDNIYVIGRSPGVIKVEENLPEGYSGFYWGDCGAIPVDEFMEFMKKEKADEWSGKTDRCYSRSGGKIKTQTTGSQ